MSKKQSEKVAKFERKLPLWKTKKAVEFEANISLSRKWFESEKFCFVSKDMKLLF